MRPASLRSAMPILDPVSAANLTVYLVQLPRSRTASRKQSTAPPPPVEFLTLERARTAGEVVISATGATERVRLENHSKQDLFIQAGEILRGGDQDRAVAGDLIIPAFRHEPQSCMVPVFCAEPERSGPMRGGTPGLFTQFDQSCPGRRLKKELRLGTQEDVWRETTATRDVVFDIVSRGGAWPTPPYALWTLNELLETGGALTPYLHPLLPLAESRQEATGAVFVVNGKLNNAELYATPALFRQLWPKLLWAMTVEAVVERTRTSVGGSGTVPTKGEVTAWLAATHRRGAAGHTDRINKRVHRRIRSVGTQICFECLDQEQDGLCVHETILSNE